MLHPILKILNERRQGKVVGIPSYCTANRKVIETILRDAAKHGRTVLIEATANQVDQFGGYTGMKPKDYVRFIEEIAAQTGCEQIQNTGTNFALIELVAAKDAEEQAEKE